MPKSITGARNMSRDGKKDLKTIVAANVCKLNYRSLKLQVKELQRQLELSQRENLLLKKVQDLEGEWLLDQNK